MTLRRWIILILVAVAMNWVVACVCMRVRGVALREGAVRNNLMVMLPMKTWDDDPVDAAAAPAKEWFAPVPSGWPGAVRGRLEYFRAEGVKWASASEQAGEERRFYEQTLDRVGWPMRSLWNVRHEVYVGSRLMSTRESSEWSRGVELTEATAKWLGVEQIPLGVSAGAFAVNTAAYAGAMVVSLGAPGWVRRGWRGRRGLCQKCAYPIGTSAVCTECGAGVRV